MKGCETWHNTCCLAEYKDACSLCIKRSVWLMMSACLSLLSVRHESWEERMDLRFFTWKRGAVHIFPLLMPLFLHVSSTHSQCVSLSFPSLLPWKTHEVIAPIYLQSYFLFISPHFPIRAKANFCFLLYYVPSCHKRWILNKFPLQDSDTWNLAL